MSRSERVERVALVVILAVVGMSAGAASFTHVHDWTMANSPGGTADWFGWANAVISELVPIGALLTVRQRRRSGGSVGYPMFLLVSAVVLSLSAQLAVAKPGPSGWLLSAVPALAFMGLSKLILLGKPAAEPATDRAAHVPVVTSDVPPDPIDVPQEVPPTAQDVPREGAEAHAELTPAPPRRRRPASETRRLADQLRAEQPELTREQVATQLGISARRLRTVLATASS